MGRNSFCLRIWKKSKINKRFGQPTFQHDTTAGRAGMQTAATNAGREGLQAAIIAKI